MLPKRLETFGLTIHPDKTHLIHFESPCLLRDNRPDTFNFLGFNHYWGKFRKGKWVVKRKTAKDRLTRWLKELNLWCQNNRRLKLHDQQEKLVQKLRGYYNYYGINGNFRCLRLFLHEVRRKWRFWLNCRNRENSMPWNSFVLLLKHYPMPDPRITHALC